MAQQELKGKTFLHRLLKIQLQIDEKCDELAYWQKQSEFCQYDAELARSIRKRSEELEQLQNTVNVLLHIANKAAGNHPASRAQELDTGIYVNSIIPREKSK